MFDGRMLSAFPAVAQFVFASCLCTKSTEKQSLNRYFGCDDLVFKCSKHYINDVCMCGKRSSSLPKRIKFRQIFLITNWCCTFFFILRLHLTTRRCQKCKCQNGPKNLQFPQNIWGEGRQSTFDFSENYSVLEEAGFPEVESPAVVIIGWYESAGQCVGAWGVVGIVVILASRWYRAATGVRAEEVDFGSCSSVGGVALLDPVADSQEPADMTVQPNRCPTDSAPHSKQFHTLDQAWSQYRKPHPKNKPFHTMIFNGKLYQG